MKHHAFTDDESPQSPADSAIVAFVILADELRKLKIDSQEPYVIAEELACGLSIKKSFSEAAKFFNGLGIAMIYRVDLAYGLSGWDNGGLRQHGPRLIARRGAHAQREALRGRHPLQRHPIDRAVMRHLDLVDRGGRSSPFEQAQHGGHATPGRS